MEHRFIITYILLLKL